MTFVQGWRTGLLLLLAAVALPGGSRAAEGNEAAFVAALRQRRLFELAERHCLDRIVSAQIAEVERADLGVELIQTLATHASHTAPADREARWQAAHAAAADFERKWPRHPRLMLIRVQDALTPLARGEHGWCELEAGVAAAEGTEMALKWLGDAAQSLSALEKELAREIPLRRRTPPPPNSLLADELTSLQQHVQYQQARARRLRGLLYPERSDDRLAQLVAARQLLEAMRPNIPADDPLTPLVRLELAQCLRLMRRFEEAGEALRGLAAEDQEIGIRLRERAESIRLLLAQHEAYPLAHLVDQGRTIDGQSDSELDLARLEGLVGLARIAAATGDSATTKRQFEEAAKSVRLAEVSHGPDWTLRAGSRLVTALPNGVQGLPADLLVLRADALVVRSRHDEALAAYDAAQVAASRAGEANAAFNTGYKAALVEKERGRDAAAARRFQVLAIDQPEHPQAATSHLMAVWHARQNAGGEPAAANAYDALLREHIEQWPTAASADQARVWLAQWAESRGNWQDALDAWSVMSASSPHFAAAHARLAQLAKDHPDSGPVQEAVASLLLQATDEAMLRSALSQWQLIASRSKPHTPRWLKAHYSVASAHFKLGDKPSAAVTLRSVLNSPTGIDDANWKTKFQALLDECRK